MLGIEVARMKFETTFLRALAIASAMSILLISASTKAQSINPGPGLININLGAFDVVKDNDPAIDLRINYHFEESLWIMRPWFGLEATSDGALFPTAGILTDFQFGDHFILSPSVGFGAYYKGEGLDLGGIFEIHSKIEATYRFDNDMRFGIALAHISNAHTSKVNTGTEVLSATFSIPISRFK